MTVANTIHPRIETLLHSITSLTGHSVALEPPAPTAPLDPDQWQVVGSRGTCYGILRVRAVEGPISESVRSLYSHLSAMIAHEADLRSEKHALEHRFELLGRHNAELSALTHSLSDKTYRDSLTGLYRRWYLAEQLRIELTRARRYRRPLSILLLEVDGFPAIADQYGTVVSDSILAMAARRIAATGRTSDIVARYGGECMASLLADTPEEGAMELAGRIQKAFAAEPYGQSELAIPIRGTIAVITTAATDDESGEGLMERAEQLLNRARRTAPGGVLSA